MNIMKSILIFAGLLFVTCIPGIAQSDEFIREHHDRLANRPEDLTIELRLRYDKKQFRQGEIIPLTLSFSSSTPDKFGFNTAGYDRSGRLMIDSFIIDKKEGTVDPLSDYFSKGFSVFMMGGLHSTLMLEAKPQTIDYELNEWVRFDKVGKYRVYVHSGRVTRGKQYSEGSESVAALSNLVEFEIISADEKWQRSKLDEIVGKLGSSVPEKTRLEACLELRFLGTKDAAKEIVRRLTGEDQQCNFHFSMGLQGSPERKFIVAEMERTMFAPEFSVTSSFLQNLVLLSYFLQDPSPLPPYPGQIGGEVNLKAWQMQRELREARKKAKYDEFTGRLELALKEKNGKALAVSTDTYFQYVDIEKTPTAVDALISVFRDLPLDRQLSLIKYNFSKIGTVKMLPILREILNRFEKLKSSNYQDRELFGIAIKSIYEIDPEEGKELILAEMRRPRPRIDTEILLMLPNKELPEFENVWLERATNLSLDDSAFAITLLERYGTMQTLPTLRATYEDRIGLIACRIQESLIRYYLKHDPMVGTEAIRMAMSARGKTKCYNSVFESIPEKYWSKEIELIVVSHLADENIGVVRAAVEVLGKYGSADVKEKIWQRFEQFSAQMRLDSSAVDKTYGDYSTSIQTIERSFIQALSRSPNWELDNKEIQKLPQLCISKTCQSEAENLHAKGEN